MIKMGIAFWWVLGILSFASAGETVTLQEVYEGAGPGDGYDKLVILDPDVIYTGGLVVERGVSCCIHGNGAIVDLEFKSVWAPGYGTVLDMDRCILTNGFSGVYVSEDALAHIRNNTVWGNDFGVTCWFSHPETVVENNVITQNKIYGVYCREYFEPLIQYNTVWGNPGGSYMKNCGWGGGTDRVLSPYPGTGEISENPGLVDPDGGDFNLALDSPCIDTGNPDIEFNDPDDTRNDMGALYFQQSSSPVEALTWGEVKSLFR